MPGIQNCTIKGVWTRAQVIAFVSEAIIPVRLAALNDDGWPLVLSLWYMPDDNAMWCATGRSALIVRHLQRDNRCAFEIAGDAPPYRGVRGRSTASIDTNKGATVLEALLDRYEIRPGSRLSRMLLARAEEEVAIRIEPQWITTWDFTRRMEDATADR